jgi:hypothetical protein
MKPDSSDSSNQFHSFFETLEERVLFDGVPDANFVLPPADAQEPIPAQVQDVNQADSQSPRALVIVDSGVSDQQRLADIIEDNSDKTLEIRLLNSGGDGIKEISEILASSEGKYDAIHILSHGDEGQVHLGNKTLSADNINRYIDQMAGWSDALTEDADLLFYGCNLAGSEAGESLIETISAVTGADVAASDDVTGAAELGGDWELEVNVGQVETSALSATSWSGKLLLDVKDVQVDEDGNVITDGDADATNDPELLGVTLDPALRVGGQFANIVDTAVLAGDLNTSQTFALPSDIKNLRITVLGSDSDDTYSNDDAGNAFRDQDHFQSTLNVDLASGTYSGIVQDFSRGNNGKFSFANQTLGSNAITAPISHGDISGGTRDVTVSFDANAGAFGEVTVTYTDGNATDPEDRGGADQGAYLVEYLDGSGSSLDLTSLETNFNDQVIAEDETRISIADSPEIVVVSLAIADTTGTAQDEIRGAARIVLQRQANGDYEATGTVTMTERDSTAGNRVTAYVFDGYVVEAGTEAGAEFLLDDVTGNVQGDTNANANRRFNAQIYIDNNEIVINEEDNYSGARRSLYTVERYHVVRDAGNPVGSSALYLGTTVPPDTDDFETTTAADDGADFTFEIPPGASFGVLNYAGQNLVHENGGTVSFKVNLTRDANGNVTGGTTSGTSFGLRNDSPDFLTWTDVPLTGIQLVTDTGLASGAGYSVDSNHTRLRVGSDTGNVPTAFTDNAFGGITISYENVNGQDLIRVQTVEASDNSGEYTFSGAGADWYGLPSVVMENVPEGVTFSQGTQIDATTWSFQVSQVGSGNTVDFTGMADNFNGEFDVNVYITSDPSDVKTHKLTIVSNADATQSPATEGETLTAVSVVATDPAGDTVAAILATSTQSATATGSGMAVTATTIVGTGNWQFSTDGGTNWTNVGTVSDTSAVLLENDDMLRFVGDGSTLGEATITYKAWDLSGDALASGDTGVDTTAAFSTFTGAQSTLFSAVGDLATVEVALDTDRDGVADSLDIDDDNDGILDTVEQTVALTPLADTVGFSFAQNIDGEDSEHDGTGNFGTGSNNDPQLLIDGDLDTGLHMHGNDIFEYTFGQIVRAGTSITLTEGDSGDDGITAIYVSFGSMDPAGDANNATGGGVGWENTVTNGLATLVYSGPSDADVTFIMPHDATHLQVVGIETHGGWAELDFTTPAQAFANNDTDSDGIADHLDLDSDNDGISDLTESGQDASLVDTNRDGELDDMDNVDPLANNDANNNGLSDAVELAQGGSINSGVGVTPLDTDFDGLANFRDLDSDNDTIPDTVEARLTAGYVSNDADTDSAGVSNNDADGDGVIDLFDSNDLTTGEFGGSFTDPVDTDGDLTEQNSTTFTGTTTGFSFEDGADSPEDAVGAPDGEFAAVGDSNEFFVLELDQEVPAGTTISITALRAGPVASDELVVSESNADGTTLTNTQNFGFAAEAVPEVITYITTSATSHIHLTTVTGADDNIEIDGLEYSYTVTESPGTPDYRDTDSDNDTLLDSAEAGTIVTAPSYVDPDGSVNDPSANLDNEFGDTSEVAYREVADTDGDGIYDFEDVDDDNDGILDTVEQTVELTPISDTVTYSFAQNVDGGESVHDGAGNQGTGSGNDPLLLLDGDMDTGLHMHGGDIFEYDFGQVIKAGTSITLFEGDSGDDGVTDIYVSFGTMDPAGDSNNATEGGVGYLNTVTNGLATLVYSGPSDQDITFIVPHDVTHLQVVGVETHGGWSELAFTTSAQAFADTDTDSDGIADHLDLDSDNDGISDLTESGQDASLVDTNRDGELDDMDNVDPLANNDANNNGLSDAVELAQGGSINSGVGVTPLDTDFDGLANFRDLDSDNDTIPDTVEARLTAGYVSNDADTDSAGVSNNDADGDGVIDLFDSNDLTTGEFGGSFTDPVDTDGDLTEQNSTTFTGTTTGFSFEDGAGSPEDAVGAPDGQFAAVGNSDEFFVLELDQEVPAGTTISITAMRAGAIASDELVVSESNADGTTLTNTQNFGFAAEAVSEVITYTTTSATSHIHLTTVTGADDDIEIDGLEYSFTVTESAPTPDYRDSDSDNDGQTDAQEAGTIAVAPTYLDPDGSVNNPGQDLANESGDTSEVAYRELAAAGTDTDGDGVADEDDIDDDNDGILDFDEMQDIVFDQISAIPVGTYSGDPDGLRVSDVTGQYSVDIFINTATGSLAAPDVAFDFNTGLISNGTGNVENGEHIALTYTTENSQVAWDISRLSINNINSLSPEGSGVRDAYAFNQPGTWTPLSDPRGAVYAVDYAATDGVGSLLIPDPDGAEAETLNFQNELIPLSPNQTLSDVLLNPQGNAFGHTVQFDFETPTPSVDLIIFDAIDDPTGAMLWNFLPQFTAKIPVIDSNGVAAHLDIDADDDGITDNVEAQSTSNYIAPSGTGTAMLDVNKDGLDDRYDSSQAGVGSNADGTYTHVGLGLKPVDSDSGLSTSDGIADYLDTDSDNDGVSDAMEAGHGETLASISGSVDTDGDGLKDIVEGTNLNDGYDVNDENLNLTDDTFLLADSDNDVADSGLDADVLNRDMDFREARDTDGDNVHDEIDIDNDNDGILNDAEYLTPAFTDSDITITFDPDEYPEESSWELRSPTGVLLASASQGDANFLGGTYRVTEPGEYTFNVFDSFGDGLTGADPAGYTVAVDGVILIDSGPNPPIGSGVSETFNVVEVPAVTMDSDGDGITDDLDIDSDNDGITDNVEAQSTAGYEAPITDSLVTPGINEADTDGDGLNDAYDDNLTGAAASLGLDPVDSDGNTAENLPDYLDLDSDDDFISDAIEAGHGQGQQTGVSNAMTDADGDGLFDDVDEVDGNSAGWDANDEDVTTAAGQTVADKSEFNLTDTAELADDLSNVNINGANIDLAFRDTNLDTDSDGINDDVDIDDDNDGILDYDEGLTRFNLKPNQAPVKAGSGNGRTWTYVGVTVVDGVTYDLKIEQIVNAGLNITSDADQEKVATINVSGNPRQSPFMILEYTLINQATGQPQVVDAFQFTQRDIDGQDFANGQSDNMFEIIGFETAKVESVDTGWSNASHRVRQANFGGNNAANRNNATSGYTKYRQTDPHNVTNSGNDMTAVYRNSSSFRVMYGFTVNNNNWENFTNRNFFFGTFEGIFFNDTHGDGVFDKDDIDSDNDGITDNVEAQSTTNYIAPSGSVADGTFVDANNDGLDDIYDDQQTGVTGTNASGTYTHVGTGLAPVNTDGIGAADYLDIDSDQDGIIDAAERGTAGPTTDHSGVIADSDSDADGDGMLDVFEGSNDYDGFDVNDENINAAGDFALADSDLDTLADGSDAFPTTYDLDYRDDVVEPDTDDDGIVNRYDIDDDNDGILDIDEGISVAVWARDQASTGNKATPNGNSFVAVDAGNTNWNESYTTENLSDVAYGATDYQLNFSVSNTVNKAFMIGFNAAGNNSTAGFGDIDYAIYIINNQVRVYENGTNRGTFGTYAAGDTLSVNKTGTTISYLKNGAVLYTSAVAANAADYYIDTSFRDGTYNIEDISLTSGVGTYNGLDVDGDGIFESSFDFFRLQGDADGDGDVDNDDLSLVTSSLGQVGNNLAGDLNGDGRVNVLDRQLWFRGRGKEISSN